MATQWWPRAIDLLGLLVTGSAVWHYFILDAPPTFVLHDLIVFTMIGGSGVGLLFGGYWYKRRPFAPERYLRVAAWMGVSTLLLVSLGIVILHSGSRQVTTNELLEAVHISGSMGLAGGLLVGTIHTRGLENAEAAARAEAQTEALTAEQERLKELNDFLRHYTLNGMQVIIGYIDQLRESVPAEEQPTLDVIEERAEMIVTSVEHVRTVSDVEATATEMVELDRVINEAVLARDNRSDITVQTPDDTIRVRAANLEGGLSLLYDALTTLIGKDGTLTIASDHSETQVSLRITATPIRASSIATSADGSSGSAAGLKLDLASRLLDQSSEFELLDRTGDRLEFELTMVREGASE